MLKGAGSHIWTPLCPSAIDLLGMFCFLFFSLQRKSSWPGYVVLAIQSLLKGWTGISMHSHWFQIHHCPPGLVRQGFLSRKRSEEDCLMCKKRHAEVTSRIRRACSYPCQENINLCKEVWLSSPNPRISPCSASILQLWVYFHVQRPSNLATWDLLNCLPRGPRIVPVLMENIPAIPELSIVISCVRARLRRGWSGREHFPRIISFVRRILRLTLEEWFNWF